MTSCCTDDFGRVGVTRSRLRCPPTATCFGRCWCPLLQEGELRPLARGRGSARGAGDGVATEGWAPSWAGPCGNSQASVEPSCDVVKGRGAPGVGGSQHPGAFCLCLPGGCPGSPVPSGLEACCFLLSLVFLFSQADFFPPAASFGGRLMGTVRPGAVQVERGTSQDPGYS